MNIKFLIFFLFLGSFCFSQTPDSLYVEIDTTKVFISSNEIQFKEYLKPFFQKLDSLKIDKKKKINIVHIGDSHIQADVISGIIRKKLQQYFGNAGRGLVFPYRVANTNGAFDVRFSSNISWESQRNIYPNEGNPVGLSGIALFTKNNDFVLEMTVKNTENYFNSIKIITPKNQKMFDLATASKTIIIENEVPKKITHTIKKGETLSGIADKYDISINDIKAVNGLKNNMIRMGKTLQIPTNEKIKKSVERSEFIPLELSSNNKNYFYTSETPLNKIYFLPNKEASNFALNGIILENNESGILYHNIGVNGAKCSDYNKFPLFFEQLSILNPELIIVSLGTNESFDKLITSDYKIQLNLFLENIRKTNPKVSVLVMSPPPSQFQRKFPNAFVADYTKEIINQATVKKTAVWDLFSIMGGLFGVNQNYKEGIISSDKVHYTQAGYVKQGELFTDALLKAYLDYKFETEK